MTIWDYIDCIDCLCKDCKPYTPYIHHIVITYHTMHYKPYILNHIQPSHPMPYFSIPYHHTLHYIASHEIYELVDCRHDKFIQFLWLQLDTCIPPCISPNDCIQKWEWELLFGEWSHLSHLRKSKSLRFTALTLPKNCMPSTVTPHPPLSRASNRVTMAKLIQTIPLQDTHEVARQPVPMYVSLDWNFILLSWKYFKSENIYQIIS